jgi:hypothetical protein
MRPEVPDSGCVETARPDAVVGGVVVRDGAAMARTTLILAVALLLVDCNGTVSGPDASVAGGEAGGGAAGGAMAGGAAGGTAGGAMAGGSAGGTAGGSTLPADAGLPAWRLGLTRWQWAELAGTSLSNQRVPNPFSGALEAPTARIDAWNGLAANRDTNRLYLAAAGGHADWAGNEVYELDLQQAMPRWTMLRGPTDGGAISTGVNYYADGRPASTHLYYALQFVRARNRIFKLSAGSVWGSGNESNSNVDAFDLATNDWDPQGTFAPGVPHGDAIDRPYAQHPVTEDCFTFFQGQFRRWSAATATWTNLAPRPSSVNNDLVNGSASAVDPRRERVIYFRNVYRLAQRQGFAVSFGAAPAVSDVTFTGSAAAAVTALGLAVQYLEAEDAFFVKLTTGGDVVRVNADTLEATPFATTGPVPPNAVNGLYTRFLFLPRLRGFAYLPRGSANVWFLPSE